MLPSAPQQGVYFSPAENKMEMEGDLDLHYPTYSPSPHALPPAAAAPTYVHPSQVMSRFPAAIGAPVPYPRVPGSSNPSGLTGESDEDMESETTYPSDGPDGDGDGDFILNQMMSRMGVAAPPAVANITPNSHGRSVPSAHQTTTHRDVQKNKGMYRSFALSEHRKWHIRIHNKKREYCFPPFFDLLVILTFFFARCSALAPVSLRGMREDFQSFIVSREAHAHTHGLTHILGDA